MDVPQGSIGSNDVKVSQAEDDSKGMHKAHGNVNSNNAKVPQAKGDGIMKVVQAKSDSSVKMPRAKNDDSSVSTSRQRSKRKR